MAQKLGELIDKISIHTLREEGDEVKPIFVVADLISIHALREEGDLSQINVAAGQKLFLSTPSARRATRRARQCRCIYKFLSTPSARRATAATLAKTYKEIISIHALREEGDQCCEGNCA